MYKRISMTVYYSYSTLITDNEMKNGMTRVEISIHAAGIRSNNRL